MRVTVISEDKNIYVDGEVLTVDFDYNPNIRAIQWYGDYGIIEKSNNSEERFTDKSIIEPYIEAFNTYKQNISETPLTDTESKRQSLLNDIISLEAQITPRRLREAMISGDNSFIEDIEKQIIELREEL